MPNYVTDDINSLSDDSDIENSDYSGEKNPYK